QQAAAGRDQRPDLGEERAQALGLRQLRLGRRGVGCGHGGGRQSASSEAIRPWKWWTPFSRFTEKRPCSYVRERSPRCTVSQIQMSSCCTESLNAREAANSSSSP